MNNKEIATKMRTLLTDRAAWTKERFARSSQDHYLEVEWDNPKADCFCFVGAYLKVTNTQLDLALTDHGPSAELSEFIATLPGIHGINAIYEFNDGPLTTHAMILDLLDRAIAS